MLSKLLTIFEWARTDRQVFIEEYTGEKFSNFKNYIEDRLRFDAIRMIRRLDLTEKVFFRSARNAHPRSGTN